MKLVSFAVVSTRQIDTQLKNIGSQLNEFETNCNSRCVPFCFLFA